MEFPRDAHRLAISALEDFSSFHRSPRTYIRIYASAVSLKALLSQLMDSDILDRSRCSFSYTRPICAAMRGSSCRSVAEARHVIASPASVIDMCSSKSRRGVSNPERRVSSNRDGHHARNTSSRPPAATTATDRRRSIPATSRIRRRQWPHVDFIAAGFIGGVRQPLPSGDTSGRVSLAGENSSIRSFPVGADDPNIEGGLAQLGGHQFRVTAGPDVWIVVEPIETAVELSSTRKRPKPNRTGVQSLRRVRARAARQQSRPHHWRGCS